MMGGRTVRIAIVQLAAVAFAWLACAPAVRAADLRISADVVDGDDAELALSAPTGIAASSDGRSVYVASFGEDALQIFARNPGTGVIEAIAAIRDGVGGVDGLAGALSAEVSRDGRNVYVAGRVDDAVAMFDRDGDTGLLTYVGRMRNGTADVAGLTNPRSLVESNDDRHVYVACDSAVVVFRRTALGRLAYVTTINLPLDSGAQGIALDPTGRNVYVGGYLRSELTTFARDLQTGALTQIDIEQNGLGGVAGLAGVSALAVSPDGLNVYANGTLDSTIVHFARDPSTGSLQYLTHHSDGVLGVEGIAFSAGLTIGGPSRQRVYAGGGEGAVAVFDRDPITGALFFHDSLPVPGSTFVGSGAQLLAVGGDVYVANGIDNRLTSLAISPVRFLEAEEHGVDGADSLAGVEGVAMSPDWRHVYATSDTADTVSAFAVDPSTGALTAGDIAQNGVDGVTAMSTPRGIAVPPDGRHVYVAAADDAAVVSFTRDAETGALAFLERKQHGKDGVTDLLGPRIVAVSPHGTHLYAAAYNTSSIAWFARSPATGLLTFGGAAKDGAGGVDGLGGAYSVAVSPDGRHVYGAGLDEDSVVTFTRNLQTGALAFASRVQDGVGGVDGLNGVTSVAVSPDGRHVYAAGFLDTAVAVFARDRTTGRLTFIERFKDNENGVLTLSGPYFIAVSPDGRYVVLTSSTEDALDVFRRDWDTGRLAFAQVERDGVEGQTHLQNARGLAIGRRGLSMYVAARGSDALAVFAPEPAAALLGATAIGALVATRRLGARR
jgi:6-phosphogluconolactonase (cycloisomerase 2 family)